MYYFIMPGDGSNTIVINSIPYQLDVAVITQTYQNIDLQTGNEHIYDLDIMNISESMFKSIFYRNNTFSIAQKANLVPDALSHISLSNQTYADFPFSLVDTILHNIINDMAVSQNMISTNSLININKELGSIVTLCDLSVSNVVNGLTWSDIVNILSTEYGPEKASPPVILTVSVIFVTATPNVNPTIVRFNFQTRVTLSS